MLVPVLVVAAVVRLQQPGSSTVTCALGLATAVAVYVLLVRWGVWRWLAAVACAPALLVHLGDAAGRGALREATVLLRVAWRPAGADLARRSTGHLAAVGLGLGWRSRVRGVGGRGGPAVDRAVDWAVPAGCARGAAGCLALGLAAALGAGRARRSGMRAVRRSPRRRPPSCSLTGRWRRPAGWSARRRPVARGRGARAHRPAPRPAGPRRADRPQADEHDVAPSPRSGSGTPTPRWPGRGGRSPPTTRPPGSRRSWTACRRRSAGSTPTCSSSTTGAATAPPRRWRGTAVRTSLPARSTAGQGAALRLGYRVAREHGARYIITTDADGQYDPVDFPAVLGPVLAGRGRLRHRVASAGPPGDAGPGTTPGGARLRLDRQRTHRALVHGHVVRAAGDARRADGRRHPEPAAVPVLRAADRRAVARVAGRRGARPDAGAQRGRQQEGRQPRLRLPLRTRGARHLVAGGLPGTRPERAGSGAGRPGDDDDVDDPRPRRHPPAAGGQARGWSSSTARSWSRSRWLRWCGCWSWWRSPRRSSTATARSTSRSSATCDPTRTGRSATCCSCCSRPRWSPATRCSWRCCSTSWGWSPLSCSTRCCAAGGWAGGWRRSPRCRCFSTRSS